MSIVAIEYTYDPAKTAELDRVRPRHRAHCAALHDKGVLIASGPWVGAARPGALFLLRAESPEDALDELGGDPFWTSGLVADRVARTWNPVVGELA